MKLIKIETSKIQIKTDDEEFSKCRINDLISVSDGEVELITMILLVKDNDDTTPLEEDSILESFGYVPTVKVIDCSILGSVIDGKFTNSLDKYPTTAVTVNKVTNEQFAGMLAKDAENSFILGKYVSYDCPAWVNGNKLFQRHACVVGNTGCGKSETMTQIMEQASQINPNLIVFDIHGEYSKLSYVDNIEIGEEPFPIWLFGFTDMVSNILKVKEELSSVVMSALRKAYGEVCDNPNENKPILFSYYELLKKMKEFNTENIGTGEVYKSGAKEGQEKTVKGDYNGKLNNIINTMETLATDKRYAFLFGGKKSDYKHTPTQEYLNDLLNRIMGGTKAVKNIDLSGVPHDIAILIIGVIAKLVYNIQLMQPRDAISPITLVCDEAHIYIPVDFQLTPSQRRMVEIFENIAKEGRKFGITLLVSSQRPSELNRTIMAQCANYIVLKMNNANDKTLIKDMLPGGSEGIIDTTTMFAPGDCLVIGDATPIPLKIHVDLAKDRPQSRTIDFWNAWREGKRIESVDSYLEEYLRN